MSQEDYVTFEQAKLLKEKGFPQDLDLDKWVLDSEIERPILASEQKPVYHFKIDTILCLRPSLHLVQKWLREEKNIDISVNVYDGDNKISVKEYEWHIYSKCDSHSVYNKYERALSEGINKALELI